MKIGPFDTSSVRTTASGDRKTARAPGKDADVAASDPSSSTQVALSSATSLLDAGDAGFDSAKVERIAQAIRDGSFRINAGAIADKLIDNAQEMLALPPRH